MTTHQPRPDTTAVANRAESDFDLEFFHDGGCSLCAREVRLLRRLDRRGRLRFTDIADPDFDERSVGIDRTSLMERIHGRLPDGTWIEGVEVFRRAYAAIGLGFLVPLSRLPGIRHLLDLGYRRFARWRLARRCEDGACVIPGSPGSHDRRSDEPGSPGHGSPSPTPPA